MTTTNGIRIIFCMSIFMWSSVMAAGDIGNQEENSFAVKPIPKVRTATFTGNDNRLVSGVIVSEDRNQITISEPRNNIIVAATYLKDEIKSKVSYQNISEYDYWENMGGYFLKRTWDFRDDIDEFIQAIRCYERAKAVLIESVGPSHPQATEIEAEIQNANNEKQKWQQEIEIRSKF